MSDSLNTRRQIPLSFLYLFAVLGILLLTLWDMSLGAVSIDFSGFWHWIASGQPLSDDPALYRQWLVLSEIRIPRAVLAVSVGFTLGAAGAALQGLLRNPLAGPGLVGVTNCAAFGAVLTIYSGLAGLAWYALPLGGIAGAVVSVFLIFFLAGHRASVLSLILAGVAINAVASSFISLTLNFSDNPYAMSEMVLWLLGSLNNRSLNDVAISLPFMVAGSALLLLRGRYLDALTLGEQTAQSLGFNPVRERTLIVLGVAMAVGAAVSVSGNIGFIGLVVPHLVRPLVGHRPGKLLLLSGLGGSLLVLLADICVQVLSVHQELKLGVVTALVGGPFFLWLIYRMRNEVV